MATTNDPWKQAGGHYDTSFSYNRPLYTSPMSVALGNGPTSPEQPTDQNASSNGKNCMEESQCSLQELPSKVTCEDPALAGISKEAESQLEKSYNNTAEFSQATVVASHEDDLMASSTTVRPSVSENLPVRPVTDDPERSSVVMRDSWKTQLSLEGEHQTSYCRTFGTQGQGPSFAKAVSETFNQTMISQSFPRDVGLETGRPENVFDSGHLAGLSGSTGIHRRTVQTGSKKRRSKSRRTLPSGKGSIQSNKLHEPALGTSRTEAMLAQQNAVTASGLAEEASVQGMPQSSAVGSNLEDGHLTGKAFSHSRHAGGEKVEAKEVLDFIPKSAAVPGWLASSRHPSFSHMQHNSSQTGKETFGGGGSSSASTAHWNSSSKSSREASVHKMPAGSSKATSGSGRRWSFSGEVGARLADFREGADSYSSDLPRRLSLEQGGAGGCGRGLDHSRGFYIQPPVSEAISRSQNIDILDQQVKFSEAQNGCSLLNENLGDSSGASGMSFVGKDVLARARSEQVPYEVFLKKSSESAKAKDPLWGRSSEQTPDSVQNLSIYEPSTKLADREGIFSPMPGITPNSSVWRQIQGSSYPMDKVPASSTVLSMMPQMQSNAEVLASWSRGGCASDNAPAAKLDFCHSMSLNNRQSLSPCLSSSSCTSVALTVDQAKVLCDTLPANAAYGEDTVIPVMMLLNPASGDLPGPQPNMCHREYELATKRNSPSPEISLDASLSTLSNSESILGNFPEFSEVSIASSPVQVSQLQDKAAFFDWMSKFCTGVEKTLNPLAKMTTSPEETVSSASLSDLMTSASPISAQSIHSQFARNQSRSSYSCPPGDLPATMPRFVMEPTVLLSSNGSSSNGHSNSQNLPQENLPLPLLSSVEGNSSGVDRNAPLQMNRQLPSSSASGTSSRATTNAGGARKRQAAASSGKVGGGKKKTSSKRVKKNAAGTAGSTSFSGEDTVTLSIPSYSITTQKISSTPTASSSHANSFSSHEVLSDLSRSSDLHHQSSSKTSFPLPPLQNSSSESRSSCGLVSPPRLPHLPSNTAIIHFPSSLRETCQAMERNSAKPARTYGGEEAIDSGVSCPPWFLKNSHGNVEVECGGNLGQSQPGKEVSVVAPVQNRLKDLSDSVGLNSHPYWLSSNSHHRPRGSCLSFSCADPARLSSSSIRAPPGATPTPQNPSIDSNPTSVASKASIRSTRNSFCWSPGSGIAVSSSRPPSVISTGSPVLDHAHQKGEGCGRQKGHSSEQRHRFPSSNEIQPRMQVLSYSKEQQTLAFSGSSDLPFLSPRDHGNTKGLGMPSFVGDGRQRLSGSRSEECNRSNTPSEYRFTPRSRDDAEAGLLMGRIVDRKASSEKRLQAASSDKQIQAPHRGQGGAALESLHRISPFTRVAGEAHSSPAHADSLRRRRESVDRSPVVAVPTQSGRGDGQVRRHPEQHGSGSSSLIPTRFDHSPMTASSPVCLSSLEDHDIHSLSGPRRSDSPLAQKPSAVGVPPSPADAREPRRMLSTSSPEPRLVFHQYYRKRNSSRTPQAFRARHEGVHIPNNEHPNRPRPFPQSSAVNLMKMSRWELEQFRYYILNVLKHNQALLLGVEERLGAVAALSGEPCPAPLTAKEASERFAKMTSEPDIGSSPPCDDSDLTCGYRYRDDLRDLIVGGTPESPIVNPKYSRMPNGHSGE